MGIVHIGAEQKIENSSQYRASDVAVLPRHRARFDAALEAGPHAHIGATQQSLHHGYRLEKIVRAVGVSHHQVASMCGLKAAAHSGAITAPCNRRHPSPKPGCEFPATVGASIVGDEDFASKSIPRLEKIKRAVCDRNTMPERLSLVQAGHDDADVDHVKRSVPEGAINDGAEALKERLSCSPILPIIYAIGMT